MASLVDSTYAQNTIIHSSGSNVVRLPITSSANTGLTNFDNLVYVTNITVSTRIGDAIQVTAGGAYIKYITYGP